MRCLTQDVKNVTRISIFSLPIKIIIKKKAESAFLGYLASHQILKGFDCYFQHGCALHVSWNRCILGLEINIVKKYYQTRGKRK